jgi:hypothetical protein
MLMFQQDASDECVCFIDLLMTLCTCYDDAAALKDGDRNFFALAIDLSRPFASYTLLCTTADTARRDGIQSVEKVLDLNTGIYARLKRAIVLVCCGKHLVQELALYRKPNLKVTVDQAD